MQINNIFTKTSIFPNHNKFNQDKLSTKIQNNIALKNKGKENAEINKINETLNKPLPSHVLSTVCSIDDLYQPIEDYFKGLSYWAKSYKTYDDVLRNLQNNTAIRGTADIRVKTSHMLDIYSNM